MAFLVVDVSGDFVKRVVCEGDRSVLERVALYGHGWVARAEDDLVSFGDGDMGEHVRFCVMDEMPEGDVPLVWCNSSVLGHAFMLADTRGAADKLKTL